MKIKKCRLIGLLCSVLIMSIGSNAFAKSADVYDNCKWSTPPGPITGNDGTTSAMCGMVVCNKGGIPQPPLPACCCAITIKKADVLSYDSNGQAGPVPTIGVETCRTGKTPDANYCVNVDPTNPGDYPYPPGSGGDGGGGAGPGR